MKVFWIFDHDFIWTLIPLVGFLWSAGGSGARIFRRYGVPLAITAYALAYGMEGWKAMVALAGMMSIITFGPGYGDDFSKALGKFYWPYIFVLGYLYGICQVGLCLHFGGYLVLFLSACACSLVFGATMYLSKKFDMPWKWAEILTGAVISIPACLVIA